MSSSKENGEQEPRGKGFMLFGVRVMEASASAATTNNNSFRKSASMNNLALFDTTHQQLQPQADDVAASGYASDDVVHRRERKRGVPWTEEEHKLFLLGLQKVGKGDWRGISRNFVKTRTPTQVASHAQKYFIRRNNHTRRRRRSSLFDITTDTVLGATKLEQQQQQQQINEFGSIEKLPIPPVLISTTENLMIELKSRPAIPIVPIAPSSKMANLNLNDTYVEEYTSPCPPLSLKLSTATSSSDEKSPAAARHSSAFPAMSNGFSGNSTSGESMISVA